MRVREPEEQLERDEMAGTIRATPKLSRKKPLIDRVRTVLTKGYSRVDGLMLDTTTAHAIIKVYDALNDENKAKFAALSLRKMVNVTWKLVK